MKLFCSQTGKTCPPPSCCKPWPAPKVRRPVCCLFYLSSWLRGALRMAGKGDMAQRLLGNLQVDSSKARALLGCDSSHFAPFSFEAGVAELFAQAST